MSVTTLDVPLGSVTERVVVRHVARRDGVDVLALAVEGWFDGESPYGYQDDDVLPFVLFSKAVTAMAADASWRPDVIHCNDWHTGLIAQEVRQGRHRSALERTGVVFTIHNIAYQGPVGVATDQLIGLPQAGTLLERGITFADRVNTVSPRYMQEILTPAQGFGVDDLLRTRRDAARGILNGVDYEEFAPQRDPWIDTRYDGSFVSGKSANKQVLQRISGLDADPDRPLLGMVARLVPQKGVGLLCSALDQLVARGAQVVVMGQGEPRYRRDLQAAARRHPGSVAYHATAREALARQVYAGSDLFLAPSVFEPCGLTPLIALRYGTIPVVRRTGGLADTVRDYAEDPDAGLGFVFVAPPRRVAARGRGHRAGGLPADRRLAPPPAAGDGGGLLLAGSCPRLPRAVPGGRGAAPGHRCGAARRRRGSAPASAQAQPAGPVPGRGGGPAPLPLALVHHANQYLITDGYSDREGLSSLVTGYSGAAPAAREVPHPGRICTCPGH